MSCLIKNLFYSLTLYPHSSSCLSSESVFRYVLISDFFQRIDVPKLAEDTVNKLFNWEESKFLCSVSCRSVSHSEASSTIMLLKPCDSGIQRPNFRKTSAKSKVTFSKGQSRDCSCSMQYLRKEF